MNLCTSIAELQVGTPIGDYSLPGVTGGAEPQEGGGIARAWIVVDPKVYDDDELDNLYSAITLESVNITSQGRLQQRKRNLKHVCLELPFK